jgi:hypothetical protein
VDVELSSQHDELAAALYEIRDKFHGARRDERLIIEAAIHLFDFERYIASGGVELRAG